MLPTFISPVLARPESSCYSDPGFCHSPSHHLVWVCLPAGRVTIHVTLRPVTCSGPQCPRLYDGRAAQAQGLCEKDAVILVSYTREHSVNGVTATGTDLFPALPGLPSTQNLNMVFIAVLFIVAKIGSC